MKNSICGYVPLARSLLKKSVSPQAANSSKQISQFGPLSISLLRFCADNKLLSKGRQLHARIISNGTLNSPEIGDELINMYAKCQMPCDALQVLRELNNPSIFAFNLAIRALCNAHMFGEALAVFWQMCRDNIMPDKYTFPCLLRACSGVKDLHTGMQIHNLSIKTGTRADVFVGNALLAMYGKCGRVEYVRQVFDEMRQRDVVSWGSLVCMYVQNGLLKEALKLFDHMTSAGIQSDTFTFASVLRACAEAPDLSRGKSLHSVARDRGLETDNLVGNALVAMYAKCGDLEEAYRVFGKISEKDAISWNAMIAGYAQSGCLKEALEWFVQMRAAGFVPNVVTWSSIVAGCSQNGHSNEAMDVFRQMLVSGVSPNPVTLVSALQACASIPTLQLGREIHAHVIVCCYQYDILLGNSLINLYSKCGSIADTCKLFEGMPRRDVVSWNVLISAYAKHGLGPAALGLFHRMSKEGIQPDDTTFLGVISACGHSGLVDDGLKCFTSMQQDFNICPTVDHYSCVVDMLARSGRTLEAENFIRDMPCQANANAWRALLSAARAHSDVEVAERAAHCAFHV